MNRTFPVNGKLQLVEENELILSVVGGHIALNLNNAKSKTSHQYRPRVVQIYTLRTFVQQCYYIFQANNYALTGGEDQPSITTKRGKIHTLRTNVQQCTAFSRQ